MGITLIFAAVNGIIAALLIIVVANLPEPRIIPEPSIHRLHISVTWKILICIEIVMLTIMDTYAKMEIHQHSVLPFFLMFAIMAVFLPFWQKSFN